MSTAGLMLVKDENDIIRSTIRNMLYHVDHIYVMDNLSTDGTFEILQEVAEESGRITVIVDDEVGHWQSKKTTALAMRALEEGHSWAVPCDADEIWYVSAEIDRPIKDFIAGLAPDVHILWAELYNHLPSGLDEESDDPVKRIVWRNRERGPLGKVACRLHPTLTIEDGNHMAHYLGAALRAGGLTIRHFSWRTPEQYVRKIRNGSAAFAATSLPEGTGTHWRMWDGRTDEDIMEHFQVWFYSANPNVDQSLIYDPAPCK